MRHIALIVLSIFCSTSGFAQSVSHTIQWESGVNKRVVKEWAFSLNKSSNVSSTTYIRKKQGGRDKLHRNGHRDVIVWIPKTTDLSKDFVVVVWFHGHWGYVPKRTFEDRTLEQLVPLATKKNFVLVLPEMPWSVHTSTPTKRNSQLWLKPGSFLHFIDQVYSILHVHNDSNTLGEIDYRIVGHSAGGSTIKRLGMTGDLCKLRPSLVVWSDSSYGNWLQLAWDHCLASNREILVKVFVSRGDSPWLRATQFMSRLPAVYPKPPENLELHIMNKPKWTHKLIGDNVVKLSNLLGETQ